MSDFEFIQFTSENHTAVISINRPEVYNALNAKAKSEIIKAIVMANKDEKVRSIILSANGKAFCTGQDLNDRSVQAQNGNLDLGLTLETEWNPLIKAIRESKKIVIAAVNGVCAGAGVSVALNCDLIVAKKEIKFVGAFAKLGLVPDAGSTHLFTKHLGAKRTMAFFTQADPLSSDFLFEHGLINRLAENELEAAKSWAQELNQMAPQSLSMIKQNIQFALDHDFKSSMERETYTQRYLGKSQDYAEGLKAFQEKRTPQFTGK